MKIYNTTNLAKDGSPISRKNEQNNTNSTNNAQTYIQPFGQPTIIQISNKGRDMQKKILIDQLFGKQLGTIAKKFYEMDEDEKERQAKLETIAELEEKLKATEGLTTEDKDNIQKDIDRLKKETETAEDKIKNKHQEKRDLLKKITLDQSDNTFVRHVTDYVFSNHINLSLQSHTDQPEKKSGNNWQESGRQDSEDFTSQIKNEQPNDVIIINDLLKSYNEEIFNMEDRNKLTKGELIDLYKLLMKENAKKDAVEMKKEQAALDEENEQGKLGINALETIIQDILAPQTSANQSLNAKDPDLSADHTKIKEKQALSKTDSLI